MIEVIIIMVIIIYLPIHLPSGRPLALGRGRILIPGFIQSPPTAAIYGVAHPLLLGGVDRGFSFTDNETQRHFSYLSGAFRESESVNNRNK